MKRSLVAIALMAIFLTGCGKSGEPISGSTLPSNSVLPDSSIPSSSADHSKPSSSQPALSPSSSRDKTTESSSFCLAKHDNYAHLSVRDSAVYFELDASFEGEIPDKSSFVLRDETDAAIPCAEICSEGHDLILSFNLSSFFAGQKRSRTHFTPRLYVNGETFDKSANGEIILPGYLPATSSVSAGVNANRRFLISPRAADDAAVMIASDLLTGIEISSSEQFAAVEFDSAGEHLYLQLDCVAENSEIEFVKESFQIRGDDKAPTFLAESVIMGEKEDGIRPFRVTFDVMPLFAEGNDNNGRRNYDYYPHLYYNDDVFDQGVGNIENGHSFTESEAVSLNHYVRVLDAFDHHMLKLFVSTQENVHFKDVPNVSKETYVNYYPMRLYKEENYAKLLVSGWFEGTYGNYKVTKEAFELFDGDVSFPAESIALENPGAEFEGGTRMKLVFDVTSLAETDLSTFYGHIRFVGEPFDGEHGDLRPGAYANEADETVHETIAVGENVALESQSMWGMLRIAIRRVA